MTDRRLLRRAQWGTVGLGLVVGAILLVAGVAMMVLLEWDNIFYEKPVKKAATTKTVVRLGLIQWQMRPYRNLDDLMQQVEYFIDAVSGYRCDFALMPEFFNAPLMADHNHLSEPEAIRGFRLEWCASRLW